MLDALEFERPIVGLDVETTGTGPERDHVVQIGIIKLYPGGEVNEWETLVNPGVPIPPEVSEIHGITDEMVKDAPPFRQVAPIIVKGLTGCDIIAYSGHFDMDFIRAELKRIGGPDPFEGALLLDPLQIYRQMRPHSLTAAVKEYLDEEIKDAHTALADARYTVRVLNAQLKKHQAFPRRVRGLAKAMFPTPAHAVDPAGKLVWRFGEACLNFGDRSGTPLREAGRSYLQWMLRANFSPEVKAIVGDALSGVYPKREQ